VFFGHTRAIGVPSLFASGFNESSNGGIVARVHIILKVAGFCQLPSGKNYKNRKTGEEKRIVFLHLFYFRNL